MQLKSPWLYSLFLVALGYQTEGCVLYKKDKKSIVRDKKSIAAGQKVDSSGQKAENRAEENPLPGRFLVLS